jgi:hypothetical protein
MAGVYNGNALRFYINGKLVEERTDITQDADLNPTGTGDLRVGEGVHPMEGYLDSVKVWGDAFEWD